MQLAAPRRLTDLPGVGDAVAARILREFGSEAAFFEAAERAETGRIAAVDGLGERRAADLVLAVQGLDPGTFLRTPRARALHEDVVARIQAFAATAAARERALTLVPLPDREEIDRRLAFALACKRRAAELPVDEVAAALGRMKPLRDPRPRFDGSVCVVVDGEDERARLAQAGLDRHCQVVAAEDGADGADADLVVYAYTTGALDLAGMENVVSVPFTTEPTALLPEAAFAWWRENRASLEAAAEAARLLGRESALGEALALCDRDRDDGPGWPEVEAAVRAAAERMNADLRERTGSLALTGDEVLEMMGGKTPRKVRDAQADVLRAAQARLAEGLGDEFHVFADGFPVTVDDEALEAKRRTWTGRRLRARFHDRLRAARRLAELKPVAEAEVAALVEEDWALMLGRFALAYDLHPARFGRGWEVEGALHLALPRDRAVPVDYHVGGDAPVALLTGANSGGKTTLLETLAQVAILAHMGLPVPARAATVEHVEALWFFTQKRSLDAGAFESFLRAFVPIVSSPTRKLVLADELEAMTELDAAARIVGTFLEMLRASGSCGVCVSHLAEEVSRYTSVRVDGIEAKGLDDEMRLVVDRTPRIGSRARSTPEFILRRLAATTEGAEREVFERILAAFTT